METVLDLLRMEEPRHPDRKALVKVVRRQLHNIIAPYLEDLNYVEASTWLEALPENIPPEVLQAVCTRILSRHASSRERLPLLPDFYARLFAVTGRPASILDLACGLHPFSFPWMGLPNSIAFHAYDIHGPRVALINQFFEKVGLRPLAKVRDVLVAPPEETAELALIFKEAHRMEKTRPGCSRSLWQALRVPRLAVSLPAVDLKGDHDLTDRHRALVAEIIQGAGWAVSEVAFENEIVFVIDKEAAT